MPRPATPAKRVKVLRCPGFLRRVAAVSALLAAPLFANAQAVTPTETIATSSGNCSPVVVNASGGVTIICQGVDPRALQRFNEELANKDLQISAKVKEAEEWADKYHAIEAKLKSADDGSGLATSAKESLASGNLDEAKASLSTLEAQLAAEKEELRMTQRISRTSMKSSLEQLTSEGIPSGGVFHPETAWKKMPISICFIDGDRVKRSYVATVAEEWTLYGEVDFDFGTLRNPRTCDRAAPSDVRVGFSQPGSWAYVGTNALKASPDQATVNFQFDHLPDEKIVSGQFRGEVLHEFGHVLGFDHSIRNPGGHCLDEIDFNRFNSYLHELGFTQEAAKAIISPDDSDLVISGAFDNKSIMSYNLPAYIFKQGTASPCFSPPIQDISLRDKIAVFRNYPPAKSGD